MPQWEVQPLNAFAVSPANIMDGICDATQAQQAIAYRIYAGAEHDAASRHASVDQ